VVVKGKWMVTTGVRARKPAKTRATPLMRTSRRELNSMLGSTQGRRVTQGTIATVCRDWKRDDALFNSF
jgi:hypothetical protein